MRGGGGGGGGIYIYIYMTMFGWSYDPVWLEGR